MLEQWRERWRQTVARHQERVALVCEEGSCRFDALARRAEPWRRHYETSAGWRVGRCVEHPWLNPWQDLPHLLGLWLAGGVWIARAPEAPAQPWPDDLAGPPMGEGCWHSLLSSSGSTGPARRLVRGWRQVLAEADAYAGVLDLPAGSHAVMLIHPWFGASSKHLFAGLLHGWSQSFGRPGLRLSPDRSALLYATPSQVQSLEEGLCSGRFDWISLTGEGCPEALWPRLQQLAAPGGRCLNALGATETGVVANQLLSLEAPWQPFAGRPAVGKQVEVVDDQGQPLRTEGAIGRLRIRAAALQEGQLQSTADGGWRLLPLAVHQGRMEHLSHDLARWTATGGLELLGRSDALLKRHGEWIDATPLQRLLERQPEVRRCLLLAEADGVVAWLQSDTPTTTWLRARAEALEGALRDQRLAAGLRPIRLHALRDWPLNRNGKVDRGALRAGTALACASLNLAPALPLWQPTLDSLDQMQLVSRLQPRNLLWCGGGLQALAKQRPAALGLLGLGFPEAPHRWLPTQRADLREIVEEQVDQLLISCGGNLGEALWLGGYSVAAWFAYAMALDLHERGHPVAGVLLLDPANPFLGTYRWRWRRLLAHWWRLGAGRWLYRGLSIQALRRKSWRQALLGNWCVQALPEAVTLVCLRSSWRSRLPLARARTLQAGVRLHQLEAPDHESVVADPSQVQQWVPLIWRSVCDADEAEP